MGSFIKVKQIIAGDACLPESQFRNMYSLQVFVVMSVPIAGRPLPSQPLGPLEYLLPAYCRNYGCRKLSAAKTASLVSPETKFRISIVCRCLS